MDPIYLDHNATTPLAAEAARAMAEWQAREVGNPASQHAFGRRARQRLEEAREAIGRILGAGRLGAGSLDRQSDRIIFTSGGTEANNLALESLAALSGGEPGEAIVSAIEHPSVIAAAERLERRGWTIHRLGVTPAGVVDLDALDALLDERTSFVAVMLANNETGAIQPVAEVARRCAARGVPLHTDAVQMVGKLPVNFQSLGASTMTIAAHKFHGPLGIGALIVRNGVRIEPLVVGGFQQEGARGGTESVALAIGMQAALEAWQREQAARPAQLATLRDRLEARLVELCPGRVVINAAAAERLPHTSSMALVGLDRQALVMALDLAGVACSTGSACASGSSEPSPVLIAMGASPEVLAGSVRFSLGATTSAEEIERAADRIGEVCARMTARMSKAAAATPDPAR